jgi:hypothetical protein
MERSRHNLTLGGTETHLSTGQQRLAVLGTGLVLGAVAYAWMFLPPMSVLGWAAWTLTGAPFEDWWYTLSDAQRTKLLYEVGTALARLAYPLTVAVCFVLWVRPLLRGVPEVPRRTLVLITVVALLSATLYAVSWSYAVRYQGAVFLAVALGLSIAWCAALLWSWARLRRTPTWGGSLVLHAATFAWIIILAFPWLGEYI